MRIANEFMVAFIRSRCHLDLRLSVRRKVACTRLRDGYASNLVSRIVRESGNLSSKR